MGLTLVAQTLLFGGIFGTFIAALACRVFCGRDNANPAQEDVVSAGAVNWFLKLGRS